MDMKHLKHSGGSRFWWVIALVAGVAAGCDSGDDGGFVPDAGEGSEDTGEGSEDTGEGSEDTGEGSEDTGEGSEDTGEGSEDTGEGSEDTGEGSEDTGEGGETWEELAPAEFANCQGCHGPSGEGTAIGLPIRNISPGYGDWVIRNGRAARPGYPADMPMFGEEALSDAAVDSILNWLAAAPKPTDGEGLYMTFCANCHGEDAQGGVVNKSVLEELAEGGPAEILEKVREGEGGNNYGDRFEYMPSWSPAELSNAEVDAIVEYLQSL
jgi:mono/diheme cytochrome c family protein